VPGGTRNIPPFVLPQEERECATRGINCVRVGPGVGIDDVVGVVDGAVRETL